MKIKNWRLYECLENSIVNYNEQFWKEEDNDKKIKFSSIESSDDGEITYIPNKILAKLKKLDISLLSRDIDRKELEDIIKQLPEILDAMKLESFSFSMRIPAQIDLSFLEHLNSDVKTLKISKVDLSQEDPSRFERFTSLMCLVLRTCNISNPNIVSKVKNEAIIELEGNTIAPEFYKDVYDLMKKRKARTSFSDKELKLVSNIYYTKSVKLSDYLRLIKSADLDSIPNLTVEVEEKDDLENIDNEQLFNLLNEKANIMIRTMPANLSKIDSDGRLKHLQGSL